MPRRPTANTLYDVLRPRTPFTTDYLRQLFRAVDRNRVHQLADAISAYASANLLTRVKAKSQLAHYRTSPYVLTASASVMNLTKLADLARFLVDTKLYMGLETSFGKQIEAAFVGRYPIDAPPDGRWIDPPEKLAEHAALAGLGREAKAARRRQSVWREVDKSCVMRDRRYLVTIKSGPQCINDTQVSAMVGAIRDHHQAWLGETRRNNPGVRGLDVVVGLTYGTPATTNNKENQILVKLRGDGFEVADLARGVLTDAATHSVRVYRVVGIGFWAFIGNPAKPARAEHAFLEALLALSLAMRAGPARAAVLDAVQKKGLELARAIETIVMGFPKELLPEWARKKLSDDEIAWLTTAMTSFFDEGI